MSDPLSPSEEATKVNSPSKGRDKRRAEAVLVTATEKSTERTGAPASTQIAPKKCKRHDWEQWPQKPFERICRKCGLKQTWGTHDR